MRIILLAAAAMSFAAGAVFAQTAPSGQTGQGSGQTQPGGAGQKPIDLGPTTPGANSAYQGGGVVLKGAPGAPAPQPQATPQGQTPSNAVPK